MNITSKQIGLDTKEIGLDCELDIDYTYEKAYGDQSICDNGRIHPESEGARVEVIFVYARNDYWFIDIKFLLSEESINIIAAHIEEYMEEKDGEA